MANLDAIVKHLEAERDRIDAAIKALRGIGQTSSGSQPRIAALFFQAIGWVRYRVGILLFRFALKSSDAFVYPSELPFLRPPARDPSREWQHCCTPRAAPSPRGPTTLS